MIDRPLVGKKVKVNWVAPMIRHTADHDKLKTHVGKIYTISGLGEPLSCSQNEELTPERLSFTQVEVKEVSNFVFSAYWLTTA